VGKNSLPEEEDFEVDCDEEQSGPDEDTGESKSDGNESDAGGEYVEDIETDGNESDAEEQYMQNNATDDHMDREYLDSNLQQTELNWNNIDSLREQKNILCRLHKVKMFRTTSRMHCKALTM
jgi:hypothetical protein